MNTDDSAVSLKQRIYSVDLLRGIVMMIMMLDHVREFVHAGALLADPTDPGTTTVPLFFTRWITHFCAPIFVFLSGVSIFLQRMNGKSEKDLSWFLLTRGLWLIVLEFTVIRFLIVFNLDYGNFFGMAQVIWVIGAAMIAMAALIYLPVKIVGIVGGVMIFLHNLFDGLSVPPQIAFTGQADPGQSLWIIVHGIGVVPIGSTGSVAFFAYALIPWVGVMMAGYAIGSLFTWESERRRKTLLTVGIATVVLFVAIRLINVYGDPGPWTKRSAHLERVAAEQRSGSPENPARPPLNPNPTEAYTILSFLNTNKYPPSLLFLLMTLGPGLLLLWLADGIEGKAIWQHICITFGRVPMFYYLLQWAWAHSSAVVLTYLAGIDPTYLFKNLLEMGQTAPPGHGFSLPTTYAVWIVGLIAVYPLCRWWGDLKARNKHWALSYL